MKTIIACLILVGAMLTAFPQTDVDPEQGQTPIEKKPKGEKSREQVDCQETNAPGEQQVDEKTGKTITLSTVKQHKIQWAVEYYGGGSDDIGDISWNLPMVYLIFPANIPNLPGHSWANAVSMATPIAHKGSTAGAKVQAATALEFPVLPHGPS